MWASRASSYCNFNFMSSQARPSTIFFFFFFNDTPPPEISPLPLPAALPIFGERFLALFAVHMIFFLVRCTCTITCSCHNREVRKGTAFFPVITGPRFLDTFIKTLSKGDRKSTRLNSSHSQISYAVFCLKKKQ